MLPCISADRWCQPHAPAQQDAFHAQLHHDCATRASTSGSLPHPANPRPASLRQGSTQRLSTERCKLQRLLVLEHLKCCGLEYFKGATGPPDQRTTGPEDRRTKGPEPHQDRATLLKKNLDSVMSLLRVRNNKAKTTTIYNHQEWGQDDRILHQKKHAV